MNPVQSLQHILNHLARTIPNLPRLAETGTFDEATLEAVMIFQRDFGLPVTGIADQATWDAMMDVYYQNLLEFGPSPLLHVFPNNFDPIRENDRRIGMLVVQAMLTELLSIVSNFEPVEMGGINSGPTLRNLKLLQQLSGMNSSGILDRATWTILAALYRALVTRGGFPTSPL